MSRLFLLAMLLIWAIALARLIAEGERSLAAGLCLGIFAIREDIRKMFREDETEEKKEEG